MQHTGDKQKAHTEAAKQASKDKDSANRANEKGQKDPKPVSSGQTLEGHSQNDAGEDGMNAS